MKPHLFFAILISLILSSCATPGTEIVVCSSLHGLHKSNPNYTYDDLFQYIETYSPEVLGVEIRGEDIDSTANYLKNYYPYEMYHTLDLFSNLKIYGIDWLGNEIEGRGIPKDYFKNLKALQLQREASEDSLFQASLNRLNALADQKDEIAREASLEELNNGTYDSLNTLYYHILDSL